MSKKLTLDQHLTRAKRQGNQAFIDLVNDLRWELYSAFLKYDWPKYNAVAKELNKYGATIPPHKIPQKENPQMSMFDAPIYLTGKQDAFAQPGDTFWLHNAAMNGEVKIGTEMKPQVKLLVSHEQDGEKVKVLSAGAAIVRQIQNMDRDDLARMKGGGIEVRLDQLPSKQGSPTNILTPADEPPPDSMSAATGAGGDDF